MTWMLTGGAGYIGSHVIVALRESGREVVVLDDMSTGLRERVPADVPLVFGSVADKDLVVQTMMDHEVTGVIHLAAKKAVGESVERPLYYYQENVGGLLSLLEAVRIAEVDHFVYSSSAGVYGQPDHSPVLEDGPTVPLSPYGETKLVGEWLLADLAAVMPLSWCALRYFNVAGAGDPALADTSVGNLIPIVLRDDSEGRPATVFGDDYPTPDGTCIRDYIHVVDLAEAHVRAAELTEQARVGEIINVGTGTGSSVLEVLASLGTALGHEVAYEIGARRAGDPGALVASVDRATEVLGWRSRFDLDDMTSSAVTALADR